MVCGGVALKGLNLGASLVCLFFYLQTFSCFSRDIKSERATTVFLFSHISINPFFFLPSHLTPHTYIYNMLEARLQTGALLKKVPTDTNQLFSGGTICSGFLGPGFALLCLPFCHHMRKAGWIRQNQRKGKTGNDTSSGNLIKLTTISCMGSVLYNHRLFSYHIKAIASGNTLV